MNAPPMVTPADPPPETPPVAAAEARAVAPLLVSSVEAVSYLIKRTKPVGAA